MDPRLKQIAKQYGGTGSYAGSGIAPLPYVSNPNATPQAAAKAKIQPGQNLFQKIGSVGTQAFNIGKNVVGKGASFVANTPKYVYEGVEPFLRPLAETITGAGAESIGNIQRQQLQLEQNTRRYTELYRAGKMDKDQYTRLMREAAGSFQDLSKQAKGVQDHAQKAGNPQTVTIAAAETAATILSAGRYKPITSVEKKALEPVLGVATKRLEDAIQKVPAVRDLVTRNSGYFSTLASKQIMGETKSQFIARNIKDLAVGMLIKRPVIYQSNIGGAQDAYNAILEGDYNGALQESAWLAAQTISGGPLGWFSRNGKKFAGKLRQLANGKNSFVDELSKRIGSGSPAQVVRYLNTLKEKAPKEFAKAEKALRVAQEVNLQATNDNVERAVNAVLTHYEQHGIPLASIQPFQLVDDLGRWAEADEIARALSPKDSPAEYVAVRWDSAAKNGLAAKIEQAGDDFQAMATSLTEMASQPGVGWGNNPILMAKIGQAISQADSAATAAKAIRAIPTAATMAKDIPERLAKRLAKLGYTVAEPFGGRKTPKVDYEDTRKLVTAAANGSDIFDETVAPAPTLESIAFTLRKLGLSPESNTNTAYDKLSGALVSNLEELRVTGELGLTGDDPARGAKFILAQLQTYINKQAPNPYLNIGTLGRGRQSALQDVRQMNVKEIMEALPGVTREGAKKLQKAITKAYTDVPLEFRGLGVKAHDYAYRVPGAKTYFRIQSALRYTYNPFFRAQEVVETKLLSHAKANNLVWMKPKEELNRVAKLLDDSEIFTTGYTGEATQDLTLGRVHANLLNTQRRDLAGLALDIAEKRGITIEDMVRDHPDELADALRVIVQYPTKGILNSPLARTLNVVFFPMRYNLKVAGLVAQEVAKLPPTLQTAVIHSLFKFSDWLKSPEGIQWQSDNADAIQVFSYFTPVQNVTSVLNVLRDGRVSSVSELGLLGGLPFGAIAQILEAEGVIHLNTPYVNPRTGDVLPQHIPQTTKARASVAVEQLLNSMFTYPGRVLGLPGKGEFIRNQVDTFLRTDRNDEYLKKIRTEDLTPLQKKWINVLSDSNVRQEQIDELYISPAAGQFRWYTLPPMNLPKPVKVLSHTEVSALKPPSGRGRREKPKALPIQSL